MAKDVSKKVEGESVNVEVDMTPLIDVTFLLIIFFMIISTFNEMERAAVKELPESQYQATIEPDVATNRMIVNILEDGTISLYGEQFDIDGFRRRLRNYKGTLQQVQQEHDSAPIIIRGHKGSRYEIIRQVLSTIYEEDFRQIMFAAYEAKDDAE